MSLDVLYTAFNRLEYVRATFDCLVENTEWDRVAKLYVYDDGSTDGTKRWLISAVQRARRQGIETELLHRSYGSPPALMNDYLDQSAAQLVAKIDSDVAVPPGWLGAMLSVLDSDPEIELLGMEAGQTEMPYRDGKPWDGVYRFEPSTHIGGVGVFRIERFRHLPKIDADGRFGWTAHQDLYRWVRGWIKPDLMAPQLDRIPVEPWVSLRQEYFEAGWSRLWPLMDDTFSQPYYDWFVEWAREREEALAMGPLEIEELHDLLGIDEWQPSQEEEGVETLVLSLDPRVVHLLPENVWVIEWREGSAFETMQPCVLGRRP